MLTDLLRIFALMAVLVLPLFIRIKKKKRAIKIPKNYNDTSEARYAINAHGFLEEIQHDKLSNQSH
jgi:hypothetical protein